MGDNPTRFRPASMRDFTLYAKNLKSVTGLRHVAAQEALAQIYGYSGLHELQQEMAESGSVGPFLPDYLANRHFGGRLEEVLGKHGITSGDTLLAASCLDLFAAPKFHRTSAKIVQSAIQTADDLHCPLRAALFLSSVYSLNAKFDLSLMGDAAGRVVLPDAMVERQRAVRLPRMLHMAFEAEEEGGQTPVDIPGLAELLADKAGYGERDFEALLPDWGEYVEWSLPDDIPEADDEDFDEAFEFIDNISPKAAATNPILRTIPDVVEAARNFRREAVRLTAECIVTSGEDDQDPSFMLLMSRELDGPGQDSTQKVVCAIELTRNMVITDLSMLVHHYNATFYRESEDGANQVIGFASGIVATPAKEGRYCSDDTFFWGLDAIAAYANDFAKEILDALPGDDGKEKIETFVDEFGIDSSFALVNVTLAEAWRGKGMLEPLLQLFCDTINNTDESLYDSGWGEAASPSDEAPGFAYVDDTANCDIGAIRYLAFPVEGTRPKQNTLDGENWLSQILNITSNHRIRVTPDPAIERVRRKLEARFLAFQERIVVNDYAYSPSEHGFAEIIVYDPWSRPMS